MLQITKEAALTELNIPFGFVEVCYPPREEWHEADFCALAEQELSALRERSAAYERKAAFGENPYFRFFKKFKKTYPVMLQFESFLLKGQPFPQRNPVTEVPFLLELTTQVLSGTHDVEQIQGAVELFLGTEKAPFIGLRGDEAHTYPGDFCARDEGGIIFSEIAGADARTCARAESRHVFYPIFGTPDLPCSVITDAMDTLTRYVSVLAPTARTESAML